MNCEERISFSPSNTKSFSLVKLNSKALQCIEEYARNGFSDDASPIIKVEDGQVVLCIPGKDDIKSFSFNLSDVEGNESQGSFQCVEKSPNGEMMSLGNIETKMQILALNASITDTKNKIEADDEKQKKYGAKVIQTASSSALPATSSQGTRQAIQAESPVLREKKKAVPLLRKLLSRNFIRGLRSGISNVSKTASNSSSQRGVVLLNEPPPMPTSKEKKVEDQKKKRISEERTEDTYSDVRKKKQRIAHCSQNDLPPISNASMNSSSTSPSVSKSEETSLPSSSKTPSQETIKRRRSSLNSQKESPTCKIHKKTTKLPKIHESSTPDTQASSTVHVESEKVVPVHPNSASAEEIMNLISLYKSKKSSLSNKAKEIPVENKQRIAHCSQNDLPPISNAGMNSSSTSPSVSKSEETSLPSGSKTPSQETIKRRRSSLNSQKESPTFKIKKKKTKLPKIHESSTPDTQASSAVHVESEKVVPVHPNSTSAGEIMNLISLYKTKKSSLSNKTKEIPVENKQNTKKSRKVGINPGNKLTPQELKQLRKRLKNQRRRQRHKLKIRQRKQASALKLANSTTQEMPLRQSKVPKTIRVSSTTDISNLQSVKHNSRVEEPPVLFEKYNPSKLNLKQENLIDMAEFCEEKQIFNQDKHEDFSINKKININKLDASTKLIESSSQDYDLSLKLSEIKEIEAKDMTMPSQERTITKQESQAVHSSNSALGISKCDASFKILGEISHDSAVGKKTSIIKAIPTKNNPLKETTISKAEANEFPLSPKSVEDLPTTSSKILSFVQLPDLVQHCNRFVTVAHSDNEEIQIPYLESKQADTHPIVGETKANAGPDPVHETSQNNGKDSFEDNIAEAGRQSTSKHDLKKPCSNNDTAGEFSASKVPNSSQMQHKTITSSQEEPSMLTAFPEVPRIPYSCREEQRVPVSFRGEPSSSVSNETKSDCIMPSNIQEPSVYNFITEEITSFEQRQTYKMIFDEKYGEYKKLQEDLPMYDRYLQSLASTSKIHSRGSDVYNELKTKYYQTFNYHKKRTQEFAALHSELEKIKAHILKFDSSFT
ncbi:hypothetical protein JTE90_025001 [Oedothorax gibbosus]|uniref:OCEL domain-containing protein n=1 Tax=Oedothorax gibbosus TaxID=931172 RepID=A0AAV6VWU6_9ARAC|nr:hypothetical protein JTE90_025001 [Oedothorax gibbosus]